MNRSNDTLHISYNIPSLSKIPENEFYKYKSGILQRNPNELIFAIDRPISDVMDSIRIFERKAHLRPRKVYRNEFFKNYQPLDFNVQKTIYPGHLIFFAFLFQGIGGDYMFDSILSKSGFKIYNSQRSKLFDSKIMNPSYLGGKRNRGVFFYEK